MQKLSNSFLNPAFPIFQTYSALGSCSVASKTPLLTSYTHPTNLCVFIVLNSLTVSAAEDSNSVEETDVKPTVLPPPVEKDQEEDVKVALDVMQSSSSPSSEATASTGERLQSSAAWLDVLQLTPMCVIKI